MLLDPRRILAVMENNAVCRGSRVATFTQQLSNALGTPVPERFAEGELEFLDDEATAVPASLPLLAIWVADILQHIVAEELPVVASHLGREARDKPSIEADTWLDAFKDFDKIRPVPPRDLLAKLLDTCPVASETLAQQAKS